MGTSRLPWAVGSAWGAAPASPGELREGAGGSGQAGANPVTQLGQESEDPSRSLAPRP